MLENKLYLIGFLATLLFFLMLIPSCIKMSYAHDEKMAELGYEETVVQERVIWTRKSPHSEVMPK